ncbi:GNAT family N-acetyltransferase [Bradyrhizobium sp.]|uniref:GNAT family N-acetyltransferase n=1 Tax=Bradyrhizobium sp. TaxID=376 RepID=UPI0025B8F6BD|nr:GNAT family N-acetyltransferase [Bradyrhizobium sp.]
MPTIRPALPGDAAFIARNILSSQRGPLPRGWFDIALGWDEPRCLAFVERIATAQTQSWWHVSRFIIAEVEGEAAASLCALPAAGTGPGARAAIEEIAGVAEAPAIFRRGAYTRNCWVQGGEGEWLIEHVATLPQYRGRGLVQALIAHALAAGKAAEIRQASISFLIGNEAAERSYARAGFAFAEEKCDPAFEAIAGAPGFRRFTRAI